MPKIYGTPGPRAIHPSCAMSRSLAACSVDAQLLFDRLIATADDQGRRLGDPILVWTECMYLIRRASAKRVVRWLDELESQRMIVRYLAEDVQLVQIANWWKYQAGQRHIFPSRWPPPKGWQGDRLRDRGVDAANEMNGQTGKPTRVPGGTPAGPSAGAGAIAHAGASPGSVASSLSAPGRGQWLGNARKAYEVLTGTAPNERIRQWIDDECGRYGREHVVATMYKTPDPTTHGWFGRVKDQLRGKTATAGDGP
jgi:hypothetical protein